MTTITTAYSEDLSDLLYTIEDLSSINVSANRSGKTIAITFDEAQIRASVDKAARGEFLNRIDNAILRFNDLVTKFESDIIISEEERALNLERSKLAGMEKQIAGIRNMRGMTAEMLAQYDAALDAQREKVNAMEAALTGAVEETVTDLSADALVTTIRAEITDTRSDVVREYVATQPGAARDLLAAKREYVAATEAFDPYHPVPAAVGRFNDAQKAWNAAEKAYRDFSYTLVSQWIEARA